MKKVSAKLKLTAWNSLLMILMTSIVITIILCFSDNIIITSSKTLLTRVVQDNANELEFEDGVLDIDDIDFFDDNVYTLLYSQDGVRIEGNLPEEFANEPPLRNKEITQVMIDGTTYYMYDILTHIEDYHLPMWVRGVLAVDEVANATNSILRMAIFFMPFFTILGTIGCYIIAKHTFQPIDKIVKIAEEISGSDNLSLRIDLKSGSEEIYKLANTFDKMFGHLESAFEAERQFSQNVSHELRTPTAVILSQCEYAIDNNATTQDKQEALEVVRKQATKMSKLISDLLGLIRIERGIEKPEFAKIDFSELVTLVCEEQRAILPQITTFNYNVSPNIILNADQTMMIRLVTNLLSNSFRYGKENGTTNLIFKQNDNEISLSIEDDGIGIAYENQEKIWHRFYQVDSARTAEKSESMGLGLSMVEQIAKLHNAKVSLKSEIDKGSIFTVTFLK